METVLLTIVLMLLAFAAMAVGILFGRPPIKGSCGGMSALAGGDGSCKLCGGDPAKCDELNDRAPAASPDHGRDGSRPDPVRHYDPKSGA